MSSVPLLAAAQGSPLDRVATATEPTSKDPAEAAKQFEGLLMANLFKELRKTVHTSGLFGESAGARSTYEFLLDQAVINHAMEGGASWGLKDRLEASIRAAQGTTQDSGHTS